jgi:hypothetical protein
MNDEKAKKLLLDLPWLYRDGGKSESFMHWGFSCGD